MALKVEGKKFGYWNKKVPVTDKGYYNPLGYQDWMDTLYTVPEASVKKAADALDIKNISSEKDVDKILEFLKEQKMVEDDEEKKGPENEDKFDIEIEDSDQPDPVDKYKGPSAKKKYKKKIKGILQELDGKKPNLAKQLKGLLGKIKQGKYKKLPKQFQGTLKDFNYKPGFDKLKDKKKEGKEASKAILDSIKGLTEMTADAIKAENKAMSIASAQQKADEINRRIQDQQSNIQIRGIERDPGKTGTAFFRKRKNQFQGINV